MKIVGTNSLLCVSVLTVLASQHHVSAFQSAPIRRSGGVNMANSAKIQHQQMASIMTPTHANRNVAMAMSEDADSMQQKMEDRKIRLMVGYLTIVFFNFVSLIATTAAAGEAVPTVAFMGYFASGPILYSALAYIMSRAARFNRLSSPTYKRLNLMLGQAGVVNLIMCSLLDKTPKFMLITSVLTIINSIKGASYGVQGWNKKCGTTADIFSETFDLFKSDLLGFFQVKNPVAAVYTVAASFMVVLKTAKLVEVFQYASPSFDAFMVATRLSRYARLACMSGVLITLKDAANRDRLKGNTFIQLNAVMSLAFGTMGAYLCTGGVKANGLLAWFFSIFMGGSSLHSWLSKRTSE
mmetsp:Transcript_23113/g.64498  ORF Transcript_23113/g.64498 Transcript_23113/m.64498 type:complete len:353 (-) Transcript_23113:217-1275(-)